jgi:hypothetical protein
MAQMGPKVVGRGCQRRRAANRRLQLRVNFENRAAQLSPRLVQVVPQQDLTMKREAGGGKEMGESGGGLGEKERRWNAKGKQSLLRTFP